MMPRLIAVAAGMLLAGYAQPSEAAAANQGQSDTSHATVTESLRHELVGIGSIDGQPITDVQSPSRCETVFTSKGASAVIHWRKVGNFAPQTSGTTVSIAIDDGSGSHKITMPANSPFRRVDGSLGLLADDCSAAGQ